MASFDEMFNKAKSVLREVMEEHYCNIRIDEETVCYLNSVGTCIIVHNLSKKTMAVITERTVTEAAYAICDAIVSAGNNFTSPYRDSLDAALQAYIETKPFESAGRELYDLISQYSVRIDTDALMNEICKNVGVK